MKKYVTRNNTVGASSIHHRKHQHQHHHYHYQQQQQYRGKRHKGVLDFVDTLGNVVTAYEDKEVPTAGEMDQVVLSLQTQADKYNYNHHHHHLQQHQQHQISHRIEDGYGHDDYYDNTDKDDDEDIGGVSVTSKTTKGRTGKVVGRPSKHDDYDNNDNNDDDKGNKRVRYDRYDTDLINETINQREKERAQKTSVEYSARSSSSSNHDGGLIHSPQYILNSEKVYTIFDAIIRTYGEYSREVGTAFVDTALKLTNRQIDSLACVKMLQTLFRDSPDVVHLFFDLIQNDTGDMGDQSAVDFTKNLTVDERLMFGQKHDTRQKPPSQKFSAPYHQHHHTNPTHQPPPLFHQPPPPIQNSQQARERNDVIRFLNDVREVLDGVTYQRFQDLMLEVRVIYKDKRYNLLEMKMNQVFTLLGNRNDLKMQLERLFPVSKITQSVDMFGYQHQQHQHQQQHQQHQHQQHQQQHQQHQQHHQQDFNPQMQMMGYDQMRMAPGPMHFPGAQYPTDLPRPPLGHPLYPSAIPMPAMPAMPSMQSMQSMFPGGMSMFQGNMLPQAAVGMGQQQQQQQHLHHQHHQQQQHHQHHQQQQQHHQQQHHQQQHHQQQHHQQQHGNMLQPPAPGVGHLAMPAGIGAVGGVGTIDYTEYLNRK